MKQRTAFSQKRLWLWPLVILAAALLVWLYFALKSSGKLTMFTSVDALREYVATFGPWAPVVYFLVQFAQVLFAPIPGNVTALAGGLLFGLRNGMALSIAGALAGSAVAFTLARLFGRPLVKFMVGEKIIDRYVDYLGNKGLGVLIMMFLMPFFPDDALCFVAGLTALRFWPFLLIVAVTRPPGMIFTTLVGAGVISIPIWGWILIGIGALLFLWLSLRYGERISQALMNHFSHRGRV